MRLTGGNHSLAGVGSEVFLLTPDRSAAPYQSFLFSSTLFSASSWLSHPCGGVSLISLILIPLPYHLPASDIVRDKEQPLCARLSGAACSRPCPLVAACTPAASCLPLSEGADPHVWPCLFLSVLLLSPLPVLCKFRDLACANRCLKFACLGLFSSMCLPVLHLHRFGTSRDKPHVQPILLGWGAHLSVG